MEHAQRDMEKKEMKPIEVWVLILILMEHAQRVCGSSHETHTISQGS
mgnify:CR=1 FL=1